jgi:hypothetical protein
MSNAPPLLQSPPYTDVPGMLANHATALARAKADLEAWRALEAARVANAAVGEAAAAVGAAIPLPAPLLDAGSGGADGVPGAAAASRGAQLEALHEAFMDCMAAAMQQKKLIKAAGEALEAAAKNCGAAADACTDIALRGVRSDAATHTAAASHAARAGRLGQPGGEVRGGRQRGGVSLSFAARWWW